LAFPVHGTSVKARCRTRISLEIRGRSSETAIPSTMQIPHQRRWSSAMAANKGDMSGRAQNAR
jgi:hypothetical protein